MAKRFGKFTIKKDARGYNRYYNKEGKRVATSIFEDYQKEFLQKSRRAGFKAQKHILRFPSKNPELTKQGKGGKAMPKYLQRHFKTQMKKSGFDLQWYQANQINKMSKDDLKEVIKFVEKWGETARQSEVDYDRLQGQIPALAAVGVQMYYLRKKVPSMKMLTMARDRNKQLMDALEKLDPTAKYYTHIFRVSYPEGKFGILSGDYLATDAGKFDGEGFTPYSSTK